MTDWLTNGYSDQSKVEKDRDSRVLPPDEAEALLGVHSRNHLIPLADKPSDMDIQLLKDLYGMPLLKFSCSELCRCPQAPSSISIFTCLKAGGVQLTLQSREEPGDKANV